MRWGSLVVVEVVVWGSGGGRNAILLTNGVVLSAPLSGPLLVSLPTCGGGVLHPLLLSLEASLATSVAGASALAIADAAAQQCHHSDHAGADHQSLHVEPARLPASRAPTAVLEVRPRLEILVMMAAVIRGAIVAAFGVQTLRAGPVVLLTRQLRRLRRRRSHHLPS